MNANFKTMNTPIMSSADRCGREVLGMGGSLVSFIDTGNPYAYDSFSKTDNITSENPKKKKNIAQILKWGIAGVALVAGGIYAFKKKPSLKGVGNSIKSFVSDIGKKLGKIGNLFKKSKP